jgi:hypothetical protein
LGKRDKAEHSLCGGGLSKVREGEKRQGTTIGLFEKDGRWQMASKVAAKITMK